MGVELMDTVTLQGPVVVLPADTYHDLLNRIGQLEATVSRLSKLAEDLQDIRLMREAEVEYRMGDAASFVDILAEIQAEDD